MFNLLTNLHVSSPRVLALNVSPMYRVHRLVYIILCHPKVMYGWYSNNKAQTSVFPECQQNAILQSFYDSSRSGKTSKRNKMKRRVTCPLTVPISIGAVSTGIPGEHFPLVIFSAQPKQKHHWVDYLLALYWQSHYMIDHGGFPWGSGKWEILCIFIPNSIDESGEADYCNEILY